MEDLSEIEKMAQNEQIIDLIHQSLSRKEIAEQLGISIAELHSRISELRTKGILPYYSFTKGDEVPAIKGLPTIKEQEFLDLYAEGLTAEEISEAMNITMGSVKVYLQRLRIKGFLPRKINVRIKSLKFKRNTEVENLVNEFLQENDEFFINSSTSADKSVINVDIDKVAEIVEHYGFRNKDVHLLERLYVERGLYEDAIALLHNYEQSNDLSAHEIANVSELKHTLRINILKKLKGSVPHYINDPDYFK